MNVVITPSPLSGAVRVPASKSAAHRLLISAALADGPTPIAIGSIQMNLGGEEGIWSRKGKCSSEEACLDN